MALRGKAGGGTDGMHPRTGSCCTPEKQIWGGGRNDRIYGKAAITAPFALRYLASGNPGVAGLKPLSPPSWTPKLRFHPSAACVTDPVRILRREAA